MIVMPSIISPIVPTASAPSKCEVRITIRKLIAADKNFVPRVFKIFLNNILVIS